MQSAAKPVFAWWDIALAALVCVFIALNVQAGIVTNIVSTLLIAYIPVGIAIRAWAAHKKKLETHFVRRPWAREYRWFLLQTLVRWAFLIVWALVLRASLIPRQLGPELGAIQLQIAFVLVTVGLLQILPPARISGARLIGVALLTIAFGALLLLPSLPAGAVTTMDMPLRSDLLVFQGGRSPLINHHFVIPAQRDALDLVVLRDGKLVKGGGALSDDPCFGAPIYAPLSGVVAKIVDDRPDNEYGHTDSEQPVGNQVVLDIGDERFVMFAHLKRGSVVVHEGQRVECGEVLGQCGNSGNTSGPHLHLQVQNRPDFRAPDLRTYPFAFRNAVVHRGRETHSDPILLRRNDRVEATGTFCR